MKRVFILLFSILISAGCYAEPDSKVLGDTISVSGYGEVHAEPDQAVLSVSVMALNKDPEKAKLEADTKYKAVLAATKKHKIERLDIRSSSVTVRPEYRWKNNSQILLGTRISRSITITVKKIDHVAQLLQDLIEGEISTVNSVQTGFQDRKSLERKALSAAIEDAKEKAEFLAAQFGKKLGSAYTISESSSHTAPRQYRSEAAFSSVKQASLPEEHFGTQSVKATINVVFHSR